MTDRGGVVPLIEFETFGVAVGSAQVCGALSTFVPLFVAPTATLAALALAGWVSRTRRQEVLSRRGIGLSRGLALGVLGGTAVGFLAPPALLAPARGLVLALGLLPLFIAERLQSRPRPLHRDLP